MTVRASVWTPQIGWGFFNDKTTRKHCAFRPTTHSEFQSQSERERAVLARLDRKNRKDARGRSSLTIIRVSFASGNLLVLPAAVCLAALDLYTTRIHILDSRRRRLLGGSRPTGFARAGFDRTTTAFVLCRRKTYVYIYYIRTRCRRRIRPSAFTFNWIRRIIRLCLSRHYIIHYIYIDTLVLSADGLMRAQDRFNRICSRRTKSFSPIDVGTYGEIIFIRIRCR